MSLNFVIDLTFVDVEATLTRMEADNIHSSQILQRKHNTLFNINLYLIFYILSNSE